MRHVLAILLVASSVVPVWADEKPKPNTLTPKEIAEGWILLFDGETTFGWDAAGKPSVREGVLIHGGDEDVRASTTTTFRLYALKVEYHLESTTKDAAPVTWVADSDSKFQLSRYTGWSSATVIIENGKILYASFPITGNKGEGSGLGFQQSHKSSIHPISFVVPKGNKFSLRSVKLKPLGTKPLFNVKDLSNWNEYRRDPKRAKSQFSLSKEGLLSIKNGPGDLQSTGQWADFVLQFDCRTNGDNLNSGVFFRCIPGEYQNGYEAQIQNQKANEPKTYTIEEYDPETHKLTARKKVENWSQDYGTGAIYRRIPARRPVARDHEWFTMTVVAHGKHFATWVNGIQVVDWTDNRPENDNPRNGCRLKKGAISLQGHDPTTDLTFRNLRLADLEGKD